MPENSIPITVNGKEILTTIDSNGTQRFPCNRYLNSLMSSKFNDLWMQYYDKLINKDELRFIYQNIGYSISGYAEVFPDDVIDNPLWKNN